MTWLDKAWNYVQDNPLAVLFPMQGALGGLGDPVNAAATGQEGGGLANDLGLGSKNVGMPDFEGLAKLQAGLQSELLNQQTVLNRPNFSTPLGTWKYSGLPPGMNLPSGEE